MRDGRTGGAAGESGSSSGTSGSGGRNVSAGTAGTSETGGVSGTAGTRATGGVSGTAGTSVTGGTGGMPVGCVYQGVAYPPNTHFPAGDGCNTCDCMSGGGTLCTLIGCFGTCHYNRIEYQSGAMFPSTDGGCCTCDEGVTDCVDAPCPVAERCNMLLSLYAEELEGTAKNCDPMLDSCVQTVSSGLQCGCPTRVNRGQRLAGWATEWVALGCRSDVVCGACPPPPMYSYCGPEGRCIEEF